MASYLIDRHSPIKSGIAPKLRHRSPHSESENAENLSPPLNYEDISVDGKKDSQDYEDARQSEPGAHLHNSEKRSTKNKSMLGYFLTELTRNYKLEGDASEFVERRDRVYTSVNTPKNLEKFCAFGFLQCLDSILYMVTFLPLRIIVALVRVLTYPCTLIFVGTRRVLDGAQICDLLKGVILVVSCFVTSYMDMSMIYHIVRGQSIVKFYVFYNMLDVMDKLVSGFGQDVLDALYWTAVEPRGRKREHFGTLFHLLFAIAYVVVHTVMILIQAIILNVAFNSHNKNLLTIMMSNNFVEIKGNLFKRLDKNNLCQITYGDVKERFHYLVLLLFVFIRNMKELQWSWDLAFPIIQDAAIVMFVEIVVDWIKHAFITKFNELSASSYADFALGLAQDIASSQKKHAFTNFSDQVCRRMGFTPMPLICLLFMVCTTSFNIKGPLPWLLVCLFYLCLMSTKVLISIILLGWAQRLINERDKTTKSTATVVNSQVIPKKEEKVPSPKIKPESIPAMSELPNTRLVTVSSSVAVNTDSSMSMDSNSLFVTTPPETEILHPPQGHNGKIMYTMEVNVNSQNCSSQDGYTVSEQRSLEEKEPFSVNVQPHQAASLYTVASSAQDVSEPGQASSLLLAGADDTSESVPVKMDFQTDFYTPNQSSASSFYAFDSKPILSAGSLSFHHSSSSPVHLPGSSRQKHSESPIQMADSFCESADSSDVHPVTAQFDKPNINPAVPSDSHMQDSKEVKRQGVLGSNTFRLHKASGDEKDTEDKPKQKSSCKQSDKMFPLTSQSNSPVEPPMQDEVAAATP